MNIEAGDGKTAFNLPAPVRVLKGNLLRGSPRSAGFDLFSRVEKLLKPGEITRVPVSLITEMDDGWVGFIKDKSGMATKNHVTTRAGVIDGDYPQEWEVVMINEGKEPWLVKAGDRVAQVVFLQFGIPDTYEQKDGSRVGGFGSTGTAG